MFIHLVPLVVLLFAPAIAFAQPAEQQPPVQAQQQAQGQVEAEKPAVSIPPEILKGEAEYTTQMTKLDEKQKAEMKVIEQAFFASMLPVMESYDMAGKLIFCLGTVQQGSVISAEHEHYWKTFAYFRDAKAAEQAKLWKDQSGATLAAVSYIDHALIGKHLMYIETVQKTYAEQMIVKAGRAGVYKKTDCKAVQKALDDAEMAAAGTGKGTDPAPQASVPENDASSLVPPDSIISDDGSSGMLGVTPP